MLDFIMSDNNFIFQLSLATALGMITIEILSILIGHSLMFGDMDVDVDSSTDIDFGVMNIVNPNRIPLAAFIFLFIGLFSIVGFSIQWINLNLSGSLFSMTFASIISLIITLPLARFVSIVVGKIMPRDETNAISKLSLIGSSGILSVGPIDGLHQGVARFADKYGVDHQFLVRTTGIFIDTGETVVLKQALDDDVFIVEPLK